MDGAGGEEGPLRGHPARHPSQLEERPQTEMGKTGSKGSADSSPKRRHHPPCPPGTALGLSCPRSWFSRMWRLESEARGRSVMAPLAPCALPTPPQHPGVSLAHLPGMRRTPTFPPVTGHRLRASRAAGVSKQQQSPVCPAPQPCCPAAPCH